MSYSTCKCGRCCSNYEILLRSDQFCSWRMRVSSPCWLSQLFSAATCDLKLEISWTRFFMIFLLYLNLVLSQLWSLVSFQLSCWMLSAAQDCQANQSRCQVKEAMAVCSYLLSSRWFLTSSSSYQIIFLSQKFYALTIFDQLMTYQRCAFRLLNQNQKWSLRQFESLSQLLTESSQSLALLSSIQSSLIRSLSLLIFCQAFSDLRFSRLDLWRSQTVCALRFQFLCCKSLFYRVRCLNWLNCSSDNLEKDIDWSCLYRFFCSTAFYILLRVKLRQLNFLWNSSSLSAVYLLSWTSSD